LLPDKEGTVGFLRCLFYWAFSHSLLTDHHHERRLFS
jgi:hypothetical protein